MEKGEAEALQVPARQLYGCGLNTFFQLGLDVSENGAEPGAKIDGESETSFQYTLCAHPAGLCLTHAVGSSAPDASTLDLSEGKASAKGDPGFVSPRLLLPAPMNVAPYIEPADGTVEEVACGATFTLALTTNGTPYQWGMLNGASCRTHLILKTESSPATLPTFSRPWLLINNAFSIPSCRPCVSHSAAPIVGHPLAVRAAGLWEEARHGAHGGGLRHELG